MSQRRTNPGRRRFLKTAALAAAGAPLIEGRARDGGHTFVLIHGTWHGSWVWRDVAARLGHQGNRVLAPTCTGCGDREHLSRPEVGLDTHINDVVNAIRFAELDRFVLVGHSFAGITITGVADRLRDQVERIVFFDALVPRPGRMAAITRDPDTGDYPDWWVERTRHFVDGYRMVLWKDYPVDMLVPPTETRHVERLRRLITTHPARQWTDELVIEHGGWEGLQPAYIHCVGQEYRMSSDLMLGPARGPDWRFVELDAPRNAMMTNPDEVTGLLLSLADEAGA